jgi:hypothetical protein
MPCRECIKNGSWGDEMSYRWVELDLDGQSLGFYTHPAFPIAVASNRLQALQGE